MNHVSAGDRNQQVEGIGFGGSDAGSRMVRARYFHEFRRLLLHVPLAVFSGSCACSTRASGRTLDVLELEIACVA